MSGRIKSEKLPAMPFYFGDWKKDTGVQALSRHDRSVWFDMLGMMWESEDRGFLLLNGRPMTAEQLASNLGMDIPRVNLCLKAILDTGVASIRDDGAIFCRKMVREETRRRQNKYNGSKGGNPRLVNPGDNPTVNPGDRKGDNHFTEYANAIENEIRSKDLKKDREHFSSVEIDQNSLKLPNGFDDPELKRALSAWAGRCQKNGRPLDQITLEAQIARLGGDRGRFLRALIFSTSLTKCLNLVEPPPEGIPRNESSTSPRKSKLDHTIERILKS